MARPLRVDVGGEVYHVINRANARASIFHTETEYQHFEKLLKEAQKMFDMPILAYTIMPNHWHFVLHPKNDGDLSKFMKWLTLTHTQQYHAKNDTVGHGHLYQGRYKSFLVSKDSYLSQLIRYVEQNPLRAKLVKKSEDWRWGSLHIRTDKKLENSLLSELPVNLPQDYLQWVNEVDENEKIEQIRHSIDKGKPFGKDDWVEKIVNKFGLQVTTRLPGRPKK
jgi:putative transposase